MCRNLKSLLVMLVLANVTYALPTDSEQPIHITADSSFVDYKTGVTIYEGNVKIDQGSSHVSADRLTTKNNNAHHLEEAIAYGINQLAEYTTTPKEGDQLFRAIARIIKFYPGKSLIQLEKDVKVTQGQNSFNGALIVYNIKDQTVASSSAGQGQSGRTTIIIDPNQMKS